MENIYENGKIYAVKNDITDDIYIGSTIVPLCKRMVKHRCDAKMRPNTTSLSRKMSEIGIEHFYIELVEDYPCKNKEHLNKREGELIRELATINKRVEQRTPTEIAEQRREFFPRGQPHVTAHLPGGSACPTQGVKLAKPAPTVAQQERPGGETKHDTTRKTPKRDRSPGRAAHMSLEGVRPMRQCPTACEERRGAKQGGNKPP